MTRRKARRLGEARGSIERFLKKPKRFRAAAKRCGKRDGDFPAPVKLAFIRIRLRSHRSLA